MCDRTDERERSAIETTTEPSERAWEGFVADHPSASGYHSWRWRRVFEEAFGHETVYIAARRRGAIVGVLPLVVMASRLFGRFAISLPFVNDGGICAQDPEIGQRLVEQATAAAADRRLSYIELRHRSALCPSLPVRQHKVGMRLSLERDPRRAWTVLDRKVRNQVRKAEKSGLLGRTGGLELVDRFYGVFARNMRDLGTPVYSARFFRAILSALPEAARVFLIEDGDVTVAAAIGLVHRRTLEVPWASSLREYRSRCANVLLYWRIIEQAIDSGLEVLDFGRSTPDEGTYHFKRQWGAEPEPLNWEYVLLGRDTLPNLSPSNSRFSLAIAAWKRLPLPIANRLGPRIVRSIP